MATNKKGSGLFFLPILIALICCVIPAIANPERDNEMEEAFNNYEVRNDNPFGVLEFLHWNHPWNRNKYSCRADLEKVVALMKEAGVGWVRMDFLWQDIEPKKGEFDFAKYDQIVDLLYKNEIGVLGILDYTADWASSCQAWNGPPRENRLFVNYARAVLSRYKGKVKYWEVWNEPDSPVYWEPQDGLKRYCSLLREVYIAAKKIDPDCKILNGGLASGLSSVNNLYDNGGKGYFDILNIHIFENPLRAGAIEGVTAYPKLAHKVMERNGEGNKKIWITEIGCPGVQKVIKTENWWMGKNPDEQRQAVWLDEVYARLLKEGFVQKIFWAFFRDCSGHWDNGIDYFGIIRWDYSKKPAFKAYKNNAKKGLAQ